MDVTGPEQQLLSRLVQARRLTPDDARALLDEQARRGGPGQVRLGRLLVERGVLGAGELPPEQLAPKGFDPYAMSTSLAVTTPGTPAFVVPPPPATTRRSSGERVVTPPSIGAYKVEGVLGKGAMGVVYRALDSRLGRPVAIKMLLPQEGEEADVTARRLTRFVAEARTTAKLRHPNIVALHEVGEHDGQPFLVMDLIQGRSFEDLLREGPLAPRRIAEVLRDVALALFHAHSHSIVHRDVKPANVLVDDTGRARLTDFGLARDVAAPTGLSLSGQLVGTPQYMAPEQARGDHRATGPASDVFALGGVLYRALTGRVPFPAGTLADLLAAITGQDPTPPRLVDARVHPDLETIALTCLEKDPARRYASAQHVADELGRFLEGEAILARPPSRRERWERWARRNRGQAVTLAAATALVAGLLVTGGVLGVLGVAEVRAQRDRAEEALTRAQEAERRLAGVRARAVEEARRTADGAWAKHVAGPAATAPERLATALEAAQAAQRWHDLDPSVPAAAARFQATMALGDVALGTEQWDLAAQAYGQARGLGVDDEGAAARVAAVAQARRQESERRRATIEGLLDRTERGELAGERDALTDAVFGIVRYAEPATVDLLCDRLSRISAALWKVRTETLLAVADPDALEAQEGEQRLVGLRQALDRAWARGLEPGTDADRQLVEQALARVQSRARRQTARDLEEIAPRGANVLAERQRLAVGDRSLEVARVACEALGRIGLPMRAEEALARYLVAEVDPLRAAPAGVALARLGTIRAIRAVQRALDAFGHNGTFAAQVRRALRARGGGDLPLEGDGPIAHFDRGLARWLLGDARGAHEDLSRAIELDPGLAAAWLDRGTVALDGLGDVDAALADYTRAIAIDPDQASAWRDRGRLHRIRGDLAEARRDLDEALRRDPSLAAAWRERGLLRDDEGDSAGAIEDLERAVALDEIDAVAHHLLAACLYDVGRHEAAIRAATRALDLDASAADAWANRGLARSELGDLQGGLADLDRACALEPDDATNLANRGSVRLEAGDPGGAASDCDRAIALVADLAPAWATRGIARRALGDLQRAEADLDHAVKLDPELAEAWYHRGILRADARRRVQAIADFSETVRLQPGHQGAWANRGVVRARTGDHRGAVDDLTRAMELEPGNAELHQARARSRAALDDVPGALADYDRALEIEPSLHTSLLERGLLRLRAGDRPRGRADLERWLKENPDEPEVERVKDALREPR